MTVRKRLIFIILLHVIIDKFSNSESINFQFSFSFLYIRLFANSSLKNAFLVATDAQRSMLSGMFSFMKKTSRVRHNPESEGIYLSDLKADELDPEVAALYFPSSHRGPTVAKGTQ